MNNIRNIGVQKDCNKKIKNYLAENGIIATPMLIKRGSMQGCIRIYQKTREFTNDCNFSRWTQDLVNKLTKLGFRDFDGQPLTLFSGNGGLFCIFARLSIEDSTND
jgi:hypothetical protein